MSILTGSGMGSIDRFKQGAAGLVAAIVLSAAGAPSLAANALAVEFLSAGSDGSIKTFQVSTADFTETLVVEPPDDEDTTGVRIRGALVDAPPEAARGDVMLRVDGDGAPMDVPATGRRVAVAATLPVPGKYRFELTVEIAGETPRRLLFDVERLAPQVIVDGATNLQLDWEVSASEVDRDVSISVGSQVPADSVTLSMSKLIGPSGAQSRPTLTTLAAEGTESGADVAIEVRDVTPDNPGVIQVQAPLGRVGAYRGRLLVRYPGGVKTYSLTITRKGPVASIAEATAQSLNWKSTRGAFTRTVSVIADSEIPADQVSVSLPSLTGPNGEEVEPKLRKASAPMGSGQTVTLTGVTKDVPQLVTVAATLEESGEYTGLLRLAYPGGAKSYAVTITRSAPAASITPTFGRATRATLSLANEGSVSFHVLVRETAGRTLSLTKPALDGLTVKHGEVALGASHSEPRFVEGEDQDAVWPRDLDRLSAFDLRVEVGGLDAPGHYSGKLVLSADDHGAVDVPIAFQVRRSAWLVAGLIFFGVVVSFVLRVYLTQARPRIFQLRLVLQKKKVLETFALRVTPLRAEEREILEVLRARLEEVYEALREGAEQNAQPVLTSVHERLSVLETWIARNREVSAIRPAHRAAALRSTLTRISREYLRARDPGSDAAKQASTELDEMIVGMARVLDEVLDKFSANVVPLGANLRGEAAMPDTPRGQWERRVAGALSKAQERLRKTPPQLEDASKLLETSRLAAAQLLAADLEEKVAQADGRWLRPDRRDRLQQLVAEVLRAQRAEDAVATFNEALTVYFGLYAVELNARLGAEIEELERELENATADQAAEIQRELAEDERLRTKLGTVSELLRDAKLVDVIAICREVSDALDSPQRPERVVRAAAGGAPAGGDIPEIVFPVSAPDLPSTVEEVEDVFANLGARIESYDLLANLLVMAVAVVLGVYVLWAGNLVWGTEADILIAVLWGLGLHALTTGPAQYTGLTNLTSRFKT